MPKSTRIEKEDILEAAFSIVSEKGFEGLNARAIARKLECSVQPIYSQFDNMSDLRTELIKKANEVFNAYISESRDSSGNIYQNSGVNYIRFAKENVHLFTILFLSKRLVTDSIVFTNDDNLDYIYQKIMEKSDLSLENARKLHFDMWVFTHGLATLVMTDIIRYDEDLIRDYLSGQWIALMRRYKDEK